MNGLQTTSTTASGGNNTLVANGLATSSSSANNKRKSRHDEEEVHLSKASKNQEPDDTDLDSSSLDSEMDTLNDDDQDQAWTVAQPKNKPNKAKATPTSKKHDLPAIKFKVHHSQVATYSNPANLAKEISKCQGKYSLKIKFASIRGNVVTIATDDKVSHELLSKEWPSDAFGKGIIFLNKDNAIPKNFRIIIRGVHRDINLDEEEVATQLREQGITEAKRILARGNLAPTNLVIGQVTSKESLNKLINSGLFLFFQRHRVELDKRLIQCFNCQQIGHTAATCKNKVACLKCGGDHHKNDCQSQKVLCSNCKGPHVACSRACPLLKAKPSPKPPASYAQAVQASMTSGHPASTAGLASKISSIEQRFASNASSVSTQIKNAQTLIETTMEEKITSAFNKFLAGSYFSNFISNLIDRILADKIEQLTETVAKKMSKSVEIKIEQFLKSTAASTEAQPQASNSRQLPPKPKNSRQSTNNVSLTSRQ
jgi:hypothetical protein